MKDNFLYASEIFYSMAISFIIGIFIKRIVLPEIIGAFAFVSSVAILFNMPNSVLRNGVDRLVPKYRGLDDKQSVNRVASLSLTFLIIISIFGAVLLGLCGIFFRKDYWQFYAFLISSIVFLFSSISTFFLTYLRSLNQIKKTAYLFFVSATCSSLSCCVFVFLYKNIGYYVGHLIGGLIAFIAVIYISNRYISWREIKPTFHISKKLWKEPLVKEMLHVGFLLVFYALLFQFLFNIDRYFVKFLQGNTMLAFYNFAVSGAKIVVTLLTAFVGSFAPKIYFNFSANKNQEYLLNKLTFMVILLAYIAAFIIFIGAPFFVRLVLPNYIQSVPFFKIFTLMIIPFAQYNIGYIVAIGKNRISILIKGISILLVINVLLNWILYKLLGVAGIAWATVICTILAYILVSFAISSTYHLWYLTLLFLPALIINFWLVSYNIILAHVFLMIVIFICLYFLIFSSHSRKEVLK